MRNPTSAERALIRAYGWGHITWARLEDKIGPHRLKRLVRFDHVKRPNIS